MVRDYILSATVGYLLGCINPSYILGKLFKHVDIREVGSYNAGTTNAIISLGWKLGIVTGIIDITKGIIAVTWVKIVFGYKPELLYCAAAAVVTGHIYPVFMKFKGGKGLATLMGASLSISGNMLLVMFATLVLFTAITNYMVIGVGATTISGTIYTAYLYHISLPLAMMLCISSIMLYKHIPNYRRIAEGSGEVKMSYFIKQKGRKPDGVDTLEDFKNFKI